MKESKVYIIDDVEEVRSAVALLMQSVGLNVVAFSSASEFLEQFNEKMAGCILLDVRMPGMSGLELQQLLMQEDCCPPIIIVSGHGDVPLAVKAVKAGALDFIEKPFHEQTLLDSVHRAIEVDVKRRGESSRFVEIKKKFNSLTPREKQVLDLVSNGHRNKVIASELCLSPSTVEAHRKKVMEKMEATSLSDLMRMIILLEDKI